MKKRNDSALAFTADVLARLCERHGASVCTLASTLTGKQDPSAFCDKLCLALEQAGLPAVWVRAGQPVEPRSNRLTLIWAPCPDRQLDSLTACRNSDGTVLVERYGVTRHRDLDEMTEFLRGQQIDPWGVIALRD